MNWSGAHFHLVLNHLPILGTFFGLILLIAAMLLRSDLLKRTALVAFFIVALPGAAGLSADITGVKESGINNRETLII